MQAQTIPDKMIATVTNGSRATPDLITYSDLVWQLALEPGTPFSERPSSADLNRALRLLQDQTLILQEARKLPSADTPEANAVRDKQVEDKVNELALLLKSRTALEERMTRVGLTTEQLHSIVRDRVMVEQYLDFRFRAFAVVTDREIQDRYNQKYTRQRNSGRIIPTLEQARAEIQSELMEEKIEGEIDKFIDELREQPGTEIVVFESGLRKSADGRRQEPRREEKKAVQIEKCKMKTENSIRSRPAISRVSPLVEVSLPPTLNPVVGAIFNFQFSIFNFHLS